jgi:hypothetical protein
LTELKQLDEISSYAREAELGKEAARLIWDDAQDVEEILDPHTPAFANALIDELAAALAGSPGTIKKFMHSAAEAAKGLNVDQFQGLIEVIQNADDVQATEVRFGLREKNGGKQLLIVHNGLPVTCQQVLAMALPFLTTKTNRSDQRGRFGIGLKTLQRIADAIYIHSAPYHFSGNQISFGRVDEEPSLPDFYEPATDTLIVLDLKASFDEKDLKAWFDAWDDDGLIFLSCVSRFRWCTIKGETTSEKTLAFGAWEESEFHQLHNEISGIRRRRVEAGQQAWTVWKAELNVPSHLHPAHKTRSETTEISIAVPDLSTQGSIYIGFKTRVPVGLTMSLDAQFDPSTAREELIENDWNNWLIERCADVLADIATGLLIANPKEAWSLVPLEEEHLGNEKDRWLRGKFSTASERVRNEIGVNASIVVGQECVPLHDLAYEEAILSGLIGVPEVEALFQKKRAVPMSVRDDSGRWRAALDELGVSSTVGTGELLDGFARNLFVDKDPPWWVEAATLLIANHSKKDDLYKIPFWLSDDYRPLRCQKQTDTARPFILGGAISGFSIRWKLLDRLHPEYGLSDLDGQILSWLSKNVAFKITADAVTELGAFAEKFSAEPVAIDDEGLREIRDRFDELSDQNVGDLGNRVGAALLLDGYIYKGGKAQKQKISPTDAYLCKTLDGDNPHWPVAAGTLSGIKWIGARYEEQLKTGASRIKRRRQDGTISRGPRKFLMLLGAECTPRIVRTGVVRWGNPTRIRDLRARGAEQVPYDLTSPDMERVLVALTRMTKKDAKVKSPALLRALSRNWDRVYSGRKAVPSQHVARVYTYNQGEVAASWLIALREMEWVAIGRGQLVLPSEAVIKSSETQTLYSTSSFVLGIDLPSEIGPDIAATLGLVTAVRVSDLVSHLREIRDGHKAIDQAHVMQIYRNIARNCPKIVSWNTRIGDVSAQDLRAKFCQDDGLIYLGDRIWRRPTDLFQGKDIFHDRHRFVPGGYTYASFWSALDIREPSLDDCISFLKSCANCKCDVHTTAALIDVYRYMEPLLPSAERRQKERIKTLPLICFEKWESLRPIYFVENQELRNELSKKLPSHRFWTPPCDTGDLPFLVSMFSVTKLSPNLNINDNIEIALEQGENLRARFGHAVDFLSNELVRNDAPTREKISLGWDQLKSIPLYIYDHPITVQARDDALSSVVVMVKLKALLVNDPVGLHAWEDALPLRDYGGHAIASLFPAESRRKVEAEWVVAWQESQENISEGIRLASDEALAVALEEQAGKINSSPKGKIKVTPPASRVSGIKPRTLKESVGSVAGAIVIPGSPPQPVETGARRSLIKTPPVPSRLGSTTSLPAPIAYTNADLEQRGWEILVYALNTSQDEQLVDFRKKHGVGADGAINWKTFVELKATGRAAQSSVEMSNAEYERAKERGINFILALVSGLETDEKCEVRLIMDPANRASVRPINGIRLVGLTEAPSIVINFDEGENL